MIPPGLLAEINDHIGFVAAMGAYPGFPLFLLLGARRCLNFHKLTRDDHLCFVPALCAGADFPLFSHLTPPLDWLVKFPSPLHPSALTLADTIGIFGLDIKSELGKDLAG